VADPFVPLCGFVEGDSLGVLVFAATNMPISEVSRRLLVSASARIEPGDGSAWELRSGGEVLAATATVDSSRLRALDRIDLRRRTS
jgi:hypothetical protein